MRNKKGQFVKGHHNCNTGRTYFKKGISISPQTQFKKGHKPWSKGLKGLNSGKDNSFFGRKHTEESKKKMMEAQKGEKHWNYKGGISNNKKYRKNQNKEWVRKNRELVNFWARQRSKKLTKLFGSHTLQQWQELKAKCGFMCLCCKKSEPEIKLTEDHIIPISQWKAYIQFHPEIKYQCNDIENIQSLCQSCNSKKRVKIINFTYEEKIA